MPKRKATIHTRREHVKIDEHHVCAAEDELNHDQEYEGFDELYGPDAFMGDQYPMTPTGHVESEMPVAGTYTRESKLDDRIRQENLEQEEALQSIPLEAEEAQHINVPKNPIKE